MCKIPKKRIEPEMSDVWGKIDFPDAPKQITMGKENTPMSTAKHPRCSPVPPEAARKCRLTRQAPCLQYQALPFQSPEGWGNRVGEPPAFPHLLFSLVYYCCQRDIHPHALFLFFFNVVTREATTLRMPCVRGTWLHAAQPMSAAKETQPKRLVVRPWSLSIF